MADDWDVPRRAPSACGALGGYETDRVAALAASLGAPVREVHRDADSCLWLDREPTRWAGSRGEDGFSWAERVPGPSSDTGNWPEAAAAGACGLVIDGQRRLLHASASGVAPLYWMQAGRAAYFATSIDALARAGIGGLTPDWEAWASILVVAYPHGDRTPFAEIQRLSPAATLEARPGLEPIASPGGLAWLDAEPLTFEECAERIVEAMRAQVARLAPDEPVLCPLAGGWDSRFIACALAERGLLDRAYTVNAGLGHRAEEEYAAAVARALGVPHSIVAPESVGYGAEIDRAARRLEYQSMLHLVIHRLVSGMPHGGVCSDGLAGDVLIKGLTVNAEVLAADSPREAVFDRLAARSARFVFEPDVWDTLRGRTKAAFLHATQPFEGHPAEASLSVYGTRTLRSIALSATNVVGREHALFLPFVNDDLAAAALALPTAEKLDGSFYRRVFALINPVVAALPSTTDTRPEEISRRSIHQSAEAKEAHLSILSRSPLRPWFAAPLDRMLERGELARADRTSFRAKRLQAICAFTLWSERYADLLGEPDPGELFA